uniref:F-box domain-containing protein n=1 Tax=Oryza barthii TaxID=65489 RepID=A0A0D3ELS7_9ORYZ
MAGMGSGEVAKEHPVMDHVAEISAEDSKHPPVDAKASVADSDLDLAAKASKAPPVASKVPPVVDCEPDIAAKASKVPPVVDCEPHIAAKGSSDLVAKGASDRSEGASDLAANGASEPSEHVADVASKGVHDLREGVADLVAKGAVDSPPVHGDEDPYMDGELPGEGILIRHNRPGIDRLANDCIMKILQCLPIKEAVRTSVLAKRWHNLWMDMDSLVFCDMPPAGAGMTLEARHSRRFRDIVNGTLASLGGRYINRLLFYITNRANTNPDRLAEWLSIASWKVTGMFSLQLPALMEGDQMVLDLPCFRSAQVISLTGIRVEIRLPNVVFNDLHHLALGGVVFGELGAGLGHVVSVCCPKLQVLQVSNVRGLRDLLLDTPSLIVLELIQVVELEWLVVKASKLQILHVRNCNSLAENEKTPNPEVRAPMLKVVDWQGPSPMNALFAENEFLQSLCVREISSGVREHSTYSRIMRKFKYSDSLTIHLPISKVSTFAES